MLASSSMTRTFGMVLLLEAGISTLPARIPMLTRTGCIMH